jgi:hypothetical protein
LGAHRSPARVEKEGRDDNAGDTSDISDISDTIGTQNV